MLQPILTYNTNIIFELHLLNSINLLQDTAKIDVFYKENGVRK